MTLKSVRVLLIEDNPADAALVIKLAHAARRTLFEVIAFDRLGPAIERLTADPTDIVLCDLALPDSAGMDTARALLRAGADVPAIVLTGNDDMELADVMVGCGFQDYLVKGETSADTLERAILYGLERHRTGRQMLDRAGAQAAEAIGGGIAHEINNLMGVALGNAELLSDFMQGAPAEAREAIKAIEDTVDKTVALTGSLLSYVGRRPMDIESADIAGVVRSFLPLIRCAVDSKTELVFELSDAPLYARTDPRRLQDAILHLVANASEARIEGCKITVSVQSDGAGPYVSVADNGPGMTPETALRSSLPFFTTKDPSRHPGLGLSMVQGFARQCGGRMDMATRLGKGTTVRLSLPAAAA